MRLTLLTDGIHPYVVGGIQRHSRMLAEHLAQEGVEVTIFHTARRGASVEQARSLDGLPREPWKRIHVEFVPYPREGRYPGHYLQDSWRYSQALLARYRGVGLQSDFIYAQGLTGLAFVEARRGDGALPPVGVNLHGYEMFQPCFGLRSRLARWLLQPTARHLTQRADYVFSFSGKIRAIIERRLHVPSQRILEIPNGFDAAWLVATPSPTRSPRRFLFIGRHERRKGVPELLRVIRSLPPETGEFHFVGPLPRDPDAPPNVHYHGVITDTACLRARIDACDVLLCPSYAEGMPTVILEAMSRGLAVIATDVGATAELVDSDNGLLLPRLHDSLLRNAIWQLATTSCNVIDSMKAVSLSRAARYTWRDVARATITAINFAASRHP